MKIAVVGGTGDMGFGLALRLAKQGHELILGSRQAEKAQQAVERARAAVPGGSFTGAANDEAVAASELAVIAVPSAGHRATVEALRPALEEKPVLDITIPLAFKPLRYAPPAEGSNALETAAILGEGCRVAAGFHTVSATILLDVDSGLHDDTLIVGNDAELKKTVMELAAEIGMRAFDAGSLVMSPTVESLTPMLIGMNKRYGSNHLGIHITGF